MKNRHLNRISGFLLVMHTALQSASQTHKPIITLFSHGILDTGKQVLNYTEKKGSHAIITTPYATFNYPDARYKFWNLSLGQAPDIKTLAQAHAKTTKEFPESQHVLIGMSRGASVVLSYMALHQPKNVKALVLESPFDTVPAVLDAAADHVPDFIKNETTRTLAASIIKNLAGKHDPSAPQPIDLVGKIPTDLPMLIITSQEDKLVPTQLTTNIYQELKDTGHTHVYLLRLARGKHSQLLHGPDGLKYAQVVHAFYKKYGIPYNQILAEQGEEYLHACKQEGY